MTNLFAYFTSTAAPVQFAGAPFLLGALFMLASTLIAYQALHNRKVITEETQAGKELLTE